MKVCIRNINVHLGFKKEMSRFTWVLESHSSMDDQMKCAAFQKIQPMLHGKVLPAAGLPCNVYVKLRLLLDSS